MVIGRSEDRDNPGKPMVLRHQVHVWDPVRVTHLGQRPSVPRTQAGHMTAIDQTVAAADPCEAGAVHIWLPGCLAPLGPRNDDFRRFSAAC
jgi:hypothetical protein